jgi:NADPH:quinone reductase-like Zn-dependent oxidoreductase
MRAVLLPEFGSTPELRDIPLPQSAEGEVRVRVHAASVNGFDLPWPTATSKAEWSTVSRWSWGRTSPA